MEDRLIIRSYRRVFEVDRRIYRVDRWAMPVPGGVPLRGVGYFAATVGRMVILGALPAVGELLAALSPPLRYIVVPLAVAVLGRMVRGQVVVSSRSCIARARRSAASARSSAPRARLRAFAARCIAKRVRVCDSA
jgi:hypothetical protein